MTGGKPKTRLRLGLAFTGILWLDVPMTVLTGFIYYDMNQENWFTTPDGIGRVWYDSREEAEANVGMLPIRCLYMKEDDYL